MATVPQKTTTEIQQIKAAQGAIHVVSVGVSIQLKNSGYKSLIQCKQDAIDVHEAFKNTTQLNANPNHMVLLLNPSQGLVFSSIKEMVANAEEKDRILFYFSGHGEQIDGKFYLVPNDAYSHTEPNALIDYEEIKSILSSSIAKQKVVILDACFSGPDTTDIKKSSALISKTFLTKVLKASTGTLVITSSSDSQSSTTKSPGPNNTNSLFTYFLLKALKGCAEALDNGLLTADSLYQYLSVNVTKYSKSFGNIQTPVKVEAASGLSFVFGDYSQVMSLNSQNLGQISSSITFSDSESMRSKALMPPAGTDLSDYTCMSEVIDYNLPKIYKEEIGRKRASIKKALGLQWSDIEIDRTSFSFDDGGFSITYTEIDERNGVIERQLHFFKSWFIKPDLIVTALKSLNFNPTEIILGLSKTVNLNSFADDLELQGWEVESFGEDKIVASLEGEYTAIVEENQISFKGFSPSQILGSDKESGNTEIASTLYALIGTES